VGRKHGEEPWLPERWKMEYQMGRSKANAVIPILKQPRIIRMVRIKGLTG